MAKGSGGPRLGCGAKFIKFTLIVFNLIFFVSANAGATAFLPKIVLEVYARHDFTFIKH